MPFEVLLRALTRVTAKFMRKNTYNSLDSRHLSKEGPQPDVSKNYTDYFRIIVKCCPEMDLFLNNTYMTFQMVNCLVFMVNEQTVLFCFFHLIILFCLSEC